MEISDNSKSMPLLSAVENDIRHEDEVIFSMPGEDINNVNPITSKETSTGILRGRRLVKVLDDFSKTNTDEVDGSISTRYSFVIHYDRWKCLAAAYYLAFCFGVISYFPKYSNQIRDAMQLSQTELSWLSTTGIIALNTYVVPGMFVDKYKPSTNLFIGIILAVIGYFGLYLTTNLSFGDITVKWPLYVFFFFMNHGVTWIDLTVGAVVVKNFPQNKGMALGLELVQVGLAPLSMLVFDRGFFGKHDDIDAMQRIQTTSIVPCKNDQFVAGDLLLNIEDSWNSNSTMPSSAYYEAKGVPILLVIGLITLSIGCIAPNFMRFPHRNIVTNSALGSGGKTKIYLIYGIAFITLVYCTVDSSINYIATQNQTRVAPGVHFLFACGLIVFYTIPFILILRTKRNMGKLKDITKLGKSHQRESIITNDESYINSNNNTSEDNLEDTRTYYRNFVLMEALSSIEFWLLVITIFGGTGNNYMVQYQLSQIVTAIGGSEDDLSFYLMVVIAMQVATRIVFGSLQDKLQTKCGLPRPLLVFFIIFFCGGGSQLILAYSYYNRYLVMIGISLSYVSFGATWTIIGALTSDIVGPKKYGQIFSFICLGGMGGVIFNSFIAATNYETEILKNGGNAKHICCGYQCYQTTFLVVGIITFALSIAPLILYFKTRKFYKKLQQSRRKKSGDAL